MIVVLLAAGNLPAIEPGIGRLAEVTGRPEYKHARWGVYVVDAESGDVVHSLNPDQMFVPASTTKLFSCAAALGELGVGHRFVTRVVARGAAVEGELKGDLILVASGDPTLGGRTKPDGTMAFTNGDHTYAEPTSANASVTDTDPLAGLNALAERVRASGITSISGDVLIDDRLFETAQGSGSGPRAVSPIVVNDNVVDFVITGGPDGAKVEVRPQTQYVQADVQVTTGSRANVTIETVGPRRVVVRGTVPANGRSFVRIWPVDNPAAFARCVFIECLRRAGVTTKASPLGEPRSALPDAETLAGCRTVAEFTSPPLSELVKVTLKVSHNLYASTLPMLVAAKHGKRTLPEGLRKMQANLKSAGMDANAVSFAGGAGGSPADSTTPRVTVELMRIVRTTATWPALEAGMPVLGVDGTLAEVVGESSPARGQVRGKTGTLIWTDFFNGRSLLRSKALAGTLTSRAGRPLLFALFVNDVPLPAGVTSAREGRALGALCELLYEGAGP
jgi:D-alanyl-D-alanine carboxypeptidase/D-alanyl-D-alanine-endopeptidase (penicillin-binding protein 4)